ncbi:MAG: bifunctional (p)ppGpp synthetase/guanosine-3',5'-bis(diphosphate) 3'-pyrophosphohydrolase [Veillonella dispar]|jgi:guanosine-3',5'-bis(diphosphate) 3'-pyrophosphohydrolase|uniref:RelA/SpoT family protein n=1 Tax=Veillonella dispar TaxID=39778 RepID=UPI0025FB11D1|nr:bifunctional (p)ppGpp synthetase/guanosine-3',5'-bis(diphosphate) 3'-pyrophosphohydrolase [Veillonella dispar]MDU4877678.1 bifunctional (p)ppGpp synthetase/guanosine-3',5'-bis(diphosphate) 3'-pyrophosphohydrolase [Veillonella dispar]MDU4885177.1 bifunctional (p)ppGpp synthetase/guanosine-3',5'-bis(diphosphate) 3'-pyrophosphohydrolase [Veillonella dispar]MDU6960111.1 bifunctional (p)ppGpp synthetase/guanosine-3',5'-bis(diphosphate) 3'-pyrophosphohydrolase [Veillonella dispar]MDU7639217.1 bifu
MTTVNEEGKALVEQSTFDKEKALAEFMEYIHTYLTDDECNQVLKAFELADKAHEGQLRASGEPYIMHPLAVADILAHLQIDHITLMAALMHDVVEDTSYSKEDLEEMFGSEVAFLVDGVTKLNQFQYETKEDRQMENYRKMILAMAKDVRVVVIKLADRLHNMRTLKHMRSDKQKRIAKETLEIFAPLAHRLGIFNVKWELEDLSFRYLEPEKYYDLVDQMKQKRQAREDIVNDTMSQLTKALGEAHIKADIKGRPKHFYSIYKKMKKDNRDLSQIYDLLAVRVIVDTIPDCYAVLGIAHSLWKPLPYRFKDYISMPKSNMYQSLHTTVIGTMGQPVEIQIRTWEMHRVSEYGVAAHWRYKEGNKNGDKDFDQKVAWLRQVLEWQDTSNPTELVNALKLDVFSGEVFVFTPKGDVVKLPIGSVPLDFAYRVHTDVGHRCVGAKVNGKIVPLDYTLQNGDIVDIITSKTGRPSLDWLNIVGSSESKSKIRNWFKRENKAENIEKGLEALEKEAKRLNYSWKELIGDNRLQQVTKQLKAGTEEEMFAACGYGGIPVSTVLLRLIELYKKSKEAEESKHSTEQIIEKLKAQGPKTTKNGTGVLVKGEAGVMVRMAKCCSPVPGDDIIGYITRGRGVSIHRSDCTSLGHTPEDLERMIEVSWDGSSGESFHVGIDIQAYDRNGLLMEVMAVLSELKITITNINAKVQEDTKTVSINVVVDIRDISQLDFVMTKLRRIREVYTVQRSKGGA